jgi:hypothetical protein
MPISRMSANSNASASKSQLDSSPSRLSARRNRRSFDSSRSSMVTAGICSSPIFLAARTRPQPATTRRSASTTTGKTMPNCSRLDCSLRSCAAGCLRVSRPSGLSELTSVSLGLRSRDTAKPFPPCPGIPFINSWPVFDEEEMFAAPMACLRDRVVITVLRDSRVTVQGTN